MKQFYIIAPALVPVAFVFALFAVFCVRSAFGWKPNVTGVERRRFTEIFGPFLISYFLWLIQPIERACVRAKLSPNSITTTSLFLCAMSGVAIATGHLATGAWAYILAGMLDVLDGRLARATGLQSKAGAFLDSVSDRWGELFVFSGCAWYLRETPWLGAVMLAVAGSMMVSYTRARGEGLGLNLDGGTMQRAERIAVVSIGTLAAAWFIAGADTSQYGPHVIGAAMLVTGVGSAVTGVGRWIDGFRRLRAREVGELGEHPVVLPASSARRPSASKAERRQLSTAEREKIVAA